MTSGCALWLAECSPGASPIGCMVIAPPQLPLPDTAGDLELERVYLLSRFQGGGLGKQLVAAAVAHSRACGARRRLLVFILAINAPSPSMSVSDSSDSAIASSESAARTMTTTSWVCRSKPDRPGSLAERHVRSLLPHGDSDL